MVGTLVRLLLVIGAFWLGGIVHFMSMVEELDRQADRQPPAGAAVVVLTGSQGRVAAGLDLVARDRQRRMLISGVGDRTDKAALAAAYPESADVIACCVDLGAEAQDTVGNAAEIAAWARRNSFAALAVVTAGYHMPRAVVEIRRVAPGLDLHPWPTRLGTDDPDRWWYDPRTFRRIAVEYHKYVAALVRARLTDEIGDVRP